MSEDDERNDGTPEDDATPAAEPESVQAEPIEPKEAFVQGMGLLFHAARGALGGLRKEIEKADIPAGLRSAAEEMKRAADAAIRGTPRASEPEWVQPKAGARIATDDEPTAEAAGEDEDVQDEPKPEGPGE